MELERHDGFQWNHRRLQEVDGTSQQQYHPAAGQPWMAVDRATVNGLHHASAAGTVEIVTVKPPHCQKQQVAGADTTGFKHNFHRHVGVFFKDL